MSMPAVLGARAEVACRLLNQTLGSHRMQAGLTKDADAPTRLAPPAFDGIQVQRQATFLRMISITEAFCVDRLLELAEAEVSPRGNIIRTKIWDKASTSAVSSWLNIQETYSKWYEIKPSWTRLNQLIEVRNAVAHGLGQLTRIQQARRATTINKITQTSIRFIDDRIYIEEINLHKVKNVCVDLISEVDDLIQAKTGDLG